jgi:hypothetical protein
MLCVGGAQRCILLRHREIAEQWQHAHAARQTALFELLLRATDFRLTGQERQDVARLVLERLRDRACGSGGDVDLALAAIRDVRATPARLDIECFAFRTHDRCVAEQLRDCRCVERRRHHEDLQVIAHLCLRFEAQGQAQIGIETALMKLVEDHHRDAFERGVTLQPASQNSFCDDLDARVLAGPRFQARAEADGLADRFAEQLCHPRRDGPRREAPRLQHDDLAGLQRVPGQQRERHTGRLARARRCLQHHVCVRGDGRPQRGQCRVDRQTGLRVLHTGIVTQEVVTFRYPCTLRRPTRINRTCWGTP